MFENGRLYRPKDPALRVLAAEWTMAQWRCKRIGPRFLKLAGGRVVYRGEDLNSWLATQAVETAGHTAAA